MIWQSVLVVVICYLYIYLDFSYIYSLFLLLPWLWWIKIIEKGKEEEKGDEGEKGEEKKGKREGEAVRSFKTRRLCPWYVRNSTLRQWKRLLLKRLTPADEAQQNAGWRSLERVRYESVQVVAFAEHPEIVGAREVELHERYQTTPHLYTPHR